MKRSRCRRVSEEEKDGMPESKADDHNVSRRDRHLAAAGKAYRELCWKAQYDIRDMRRDS